MKKKTIKKYEKWFQSMKKKIFLKNHTNISDAMHNLT
jgi:hypothetical protein